MLKQIAHLFLYNAKGDSTRDVLSPLRRYFFLMGIAKNFKCIGGYMIILAPVPFGVNTQFSQNNQKP